MHIPPLPPLSKASLPETAPPTSQATDTLQGRYAEAANTLRTWLDSGVLVPDDVPALYVYEQSRAADTEGQNGPSVIQRGLIGDVGLADPDQRIILPHENVMPGPIADRLALMSTTQANLEPIFLLYDGENGMASRLVDEVASTRHPLVSAHTEDGLTHRLWAITDSAEIAAINADLHHRQALIADGHHRYATYRVLQRQERDTHAAETTLGPWDFGLALLVDSSAYPPDLKAIHRVIPDLPWQRPSPGPRPRGRCTTTTTWHVAWPHSNKPLSPPSCSPANRAHTYSPTRTRCNSPAPCRPITLTAGTRSTPPSSPSSCCLWCGACATARKPYASSTTTRPPQSAWRPAPAAPP
ncbi:DUF1015 domain-containing protein [Nonomuraea antimicrobica]